MSTCSWPVNQFESLDFDIYGGDTTWNAVAGLYIFTFQASDASWIPLYVGQTDDFFSRLPSHERLDEAIQLGATHIHAKVVAQQSQRDLWERMLIQYLQPQMNFQYR